MHSGGSHIGVPSASPTAMARNFIKHFLITLAAGAVIQLIAADRPALSGTWHLDVEDSRFGAMPPIESGVLVISTSPHKMFHLTVSTKSAHAERTVEDDWKIDDHYHPVDGPSSGEVLAKWEGSVLLGKRHTDAGLEEIRFRLSPDGGSLTECIVTGANTTTLIWRRQ